MSDGIRNRDRNAVPKLDTRGALALGQEVVMIGREAGPLPAAVARSLGRLASARDALAQADRDRIGAPQPVGGTEVRRATHAAWRALDRFLESWAALPEGSEAEVARRIAAVLFGEGRRFLQSPPRRSWVAANQRLTKLAELELEHELRDLGGGPFLDWVRATHDRHGELLHMTKPRDPSTAAPIRPLLDAFSARLGEYMLQVRASACDGDISDERAERLLEPLARWRQRRRRSRGGPQPLAPPIALAPGAADGDHRSAGAPATTASPSGPPAPEALGAPPA